MNKPVALRPGANEAYPREATAYEIANLPHVADKVPIIVWLVAFTGAAQRFAFYGTTVPWQNYLQNPPGNPDLPGALGFGQSKATIINNAFLLLSYLAPLPIALISDSWLGRYRTLFLSFVVFLVGEVVLLATSLPSVMPPVPNKDNRTTLAGFITALILIALGQGGTSVIFPFLGDQIPETAPQVILNKKGEHVVTDRKLTIQYVFNVLFWMINVACLSTLATTNMEKRSGFWAAYLLPLCFFSASMIPFILWNKHLTKPPPEGNVLPHVSKAVILAIRSNFHLSAADPLHQNHHTVPWTSDFIHSLRRSLRACRVILCFTLFYLSFGQALNNIISQANQMRLSGVSNDTIQALNPISYILLNPFIQAWTSHLLSSQGSKKRGFTFGPIARMTVGFILMAVSMAYAAIIQKLIYSRGPCYSHPLACSAALIAREGEKQPRYRPNDISVWIQAPFHVLMAACEIFGFVALNEFVYAEAPSNMKAVVKAFEQFTAALGAALGMALGPVSKDPWLVILYSTLAGTMFVSGAVFYAVFRGHDARWNGEKAGEGLVEETEQEHSENEKK